MWKDRELNVYKYRIFGISIISEIELPDFQICEFETTDVSISFGKVPNSLPKVEAKGLLYEAAPSDFLFVLDKVGKFRAQHGKSITIEPSKNASSDEIRLFLLGSVMGAIIHQRGLLPLHGSSVTYQSNSYIIVGDSASGKSSLAAGLWAKGLTAHSDDISVVTKENDGHFLVQPGVPYFKLWGDVLEYFGIEKDLRKVRPQLEKYILSTQSVEQIEPIYLRSIIYLVGTNNKGYSIDKIEGSAKFELLLKNTYRSQFIEGLGKTKDQFRNISSLAYSTDVFKVGRPLSPLAINDLVAFVEKNIIHAI